MALIMAPTAPVLVTDKSAIESLSPQEARFLFKHFFVNVPPILLNEIQADLSKLREGEDTPLVRVVALATKTRDIDSRVNMFHKILCFNSLLGVEIMMDGWCIPCNPIRTVKTKYGTGKIIDESQQERDLFRWQFGDFTDEEKRAAYVWREQTRGFDLSLYKRGLESIGVEIPRVRTLGELSKATEQLLGDLRLQDILFNWLLAMLHSLRPPTRDSISERWKQRKEPSLRDFAPYADYCLKVYLTFIVGRENNLFTTGSTSRLDLEYCFYLPFCQAFTSGDKFLKKIAPILLEPSQDFVDPSELKADLNRLADEWNNLSPAERRERGIHDGKRPPLNDRSVVSRLWQKHMPPPKAFSGNILSALPKEEVARMAEFLMKLTKEIEDTDR